jgi:GntR family transcriptional repressor for pyruvate dehydrogenase complex
VLQRKTLTSQVIDHILALIKTNNMQPGDRLPTEKQLTASLGVSRTCVREAMKSLESLKLISIRAKIGAVLLQPSKLALFTAEHLSDAINEEQTDALIEFRRIVEVGLSTLAAERAHDEDLAAMKKALEEHRQAIDTNGPAYAADIAFHMAIAQATRNPVAIRVFEVILEPLAEQRKRLGNVPRAAEEGLRDHHRIFKAIEELNPEKARLAMIAHMKTAERFWRIASTQIPRADDKSAQEAAS